MNKTEIEQDDSQSLTDIIRVVLEHKGKALLVFILISLVGCFHAWVAKPIYSTDALIQVELSANAKSIDPAAALMGMQDGLTSSAEIELIQARRVSLAAVEKLGTDIKIQPHYLGSFGEAMARNKKILASPFLGLHNFAWGGEKLTLGILEVPAAFLGKNLILKNKDNVNYTISDKEGHFLFSGKVNELVQNKGFTLQVNNLVANIGGEFILTKYSKNSAADGLRKRLNVTEKGKGTGVLMLKVEGDNPQVVTDEANALADIYLLLNVGRKSEEAEKQLQFLNEQLPRIKEEADIAEKALRDYKAARGSIALNDAGRAQLEQMTGADTELADAQLELSAALQRFTDQHPNVVVLREKVARLNGRKSKAESSLDVLPAVEQELVKLTREAKLKSDLYILILNKTQELKVSKAGTIGNVVIVDRAIVRNEPSAPKRLNILLIYVLAGIILGLIVAFIAKSLQRVIEHYDEVEPRTGLPVYGIIPRSDRQVKITEKRKEKSFNSQLLSVIDPRDGAVESLRSLRTSLQFALADAKNNIICIAGATPSLGKSFLNMNLAALMAESGRRVLLIDGDLRRGRMHNYLSNQGQLPGFAELLANNAETKDVIRAIQDIPNLSYVACGQYPPNPAELLGSERFVRIMEQFSKDFDVVIIDSAPIMNLADALLVNRICGVVLFTVREGQTTWQDVELALARYQRDNIAIKGVVVNSVKVSRSRYGYSYAYPAYEYK